LSDLRSGAAAASDAGLVSLSIVARVLGVPADPAVLAHEFAPPGKPCGETELLRAAKALGLKARALKLDRAALRDAPLPAIGFDCDGTAFVIGKFAEEGVLIQDPRKPGPEALRWDAFEARWSGEAILLAKRALLPAALERFNIGWFVPALERYRGLLGEVLLASFFIQLLALATPLFFQVIVDKVLVHRGLSTLDVLCVAMIVVAVFEVTLGALRTYVFSHTTNRIDVELGARLFQHLLALPLAYFEARRVGDSVARVRELENIRNFLTGTALTVVIDAVFTVVFLAFMFWYAPLLAWIVLATVPAYALLSVIVTPIFRARLNEKFARGAENQSFLVETVTGIQTVKALAVEPQLRRRWEEQLAEYVRSSFRASNLGNVSSQIAQLISKIATILTLWFGARMVMGGELSMGQLIAFNMMAGRVSGPLLRLVQLWQDFQQAGISLQRLGDILNTPTESSQGAARSRLPELKGALKFEHVTFRYGPQLPPVLTDLSLEIQPGEVLGIVGRSGSGKSTLTKLVQRLYLPEAGRVFVDGVDLALIDPVWLRRNIGVVLQENYLFNRTVRENIALADPAMPLERVMQVANLAGAHEFIVELPQGYDTVLGEHGSNLSGGQRQRIAIARALATNPRVLIFDEATSALDYESERIIQDNMRMIARNRTVLIIAHRLSTVRHANRIIVVERGRIEEQGGHAELLAQNGRYARLHSQQTGAKVG